MANKAVVPCAACGKTITLGGRSKPAGEAMCRPCFLVRKGQDRVHGVAGYGRGCRCELCKQAAYARNRERYKTHNRYDYVPRERICMICGSVFTDRNHGAKTCSPECARQRELVKAWNHQARKRGAFVAPVVPTEIFERDGWRCHICHRKLSARTKWPHPRSMSLDHLIPLSRGGHHEPANVRTACLSCNSAKGNRGGNEQLLLIG